MPISSGLKRLRDRLKPRVPFAARGRGGRRERNAAESLLAVSRAVTGDWGESIRQIVQLDAEAMAVERVTFWRTRAEPAGLRCEAGFIASMGMLERGTVLLETDAPEYFAAIREESILVVHDVREDPRCRGLRDYCASRRISSMLNVPLFLAGELVGVLCHEHVGPTRRWTERDVDIATGAARIVTSALAAREHTQAEATARTTALLDSISRVVLQSLDQREIANRAVSLVVPQLADAAIVWALDRDGSLEWLAANEGRKRRADLISDARSAAESGGPPGALATLIVKESHSVLVPDLLSSVLDRYGVREEYRAYLRKLEARSAMGVPIAVAGRTFGALYLFSTERRYGPADLELAEHVAERLAWALENARLYAVACEAIQARDDFLALASHELRTPLTALRLLTDSSMQRAQREGLAAEGRRFHLVATQAERLSVLVSRMLEAVKVRAEGVVLVPQACDLGTIVGHCVRTAGERANASDVIRLTSQEGLIGRWDPAALERAIGEVLDNGIRFGANRPVEVVLRGEGDLAEVTIRDHGIGIPADRLGAVFLPFERAVPTQHFGGLGLGLYLARAIVEAHGGSIGLTSRVGEGTTVVVHLPLAGPPVGAAPGGDVR
jgi:signal transduction histidine kinase